MKKILYQLGITLIFLISLVKTSTVNQRNLLDDEIAELENLINLYEQKIDILQNNKDLSPSSNNITIHQDWLEKIVKTQEQDRDQLKNEQLFSINQLVELLYFSENETIVDYDFVTIKPLGKSQNGILIQSAVAIALDNGMIYIYDVYGNKLMEVVVGEDILQIASSSNQDDMFIAVLTTTGKFMVFTLELERKFNVYKDKYHDLKNGTLVESIDGESQQSAERHTIEEDQQHINSIDSINNTTPIKGGKDKKRGGKKQKKPADEGTKYKSLLKMYEYHPGKPIIVDMKQVLRQNGITWTDDLNFTQFIVYQNRGDKFFVIADDTGHLTILKREGDYRSRLYSGSQTIINLSKYQLNLAFATTNKVGFVRFADSSVGPIMCDAGLQEIVAAHLDQTYPGILYVGTKFGEILLFETQGTMLKPDNLDCKLVAKVQTNVYFEMKQKNAMIQYDFKPVKGGLVIYSQSGIFEYFNITESHGLVKQNEELPRQYVPSYAFNQDKMIEDGKVKIVESRQIMGTLLLARIPGNKSQIVLYDSLIPYLRHDSLMDGFNFKFPMFIIAFAVVIIYQIYKKKKGGATEDDGSLASQFEKRGQKLSSKAKADLNEIEKMMKDLGGLGSDIKSMAKGSGIKKKK